jgi:hypothetical protein
MQGSEATREPHQADQRLRVAALGDRAVQLAQRPGNELDPLLLAAVSLRREKVGCEEQVHLLVGEARAREVGEDRLPVPGAAADLLGELALGGLQRLLPLDIQAPCRNLQERRFADRLARLAHEPYVLVVVRDDCDRSSMAHDLARDLFSVGVAESLDSHVHDPAVVDGLAAQRFEGAAHRSSAATSSESECSLAERASSSASALPAASAAPKNSGSAASPRPIVSIGSPLAA